MLRARRACGSTAPGRGETTWVDCVPGRTDLPRTLPDDARCSASRRLADGDDVPAGDGWCFRRTPRPGQGRLTGRPTIGLCVVLISPKHDTEAAATALRDWGDFVHISHIAAAGVPGYTMITPYELEGADGPALPAPVRDGRRRSRSEVPSDDTAGAERLADADAFEDWAWHPELVIDYRRRTYRSDVVMTEFFDVVLQQRACRDFSDEPVPDEHIEQILEAATHAPSAENTQPWVFIVVRDDDRAGGVERPDPAPVVSGRT